MASKHDSFRKSRIFLRRSECVVVVKDGGGNHFRLKTISWTVVLPAKIVGEMVTIFFFTLSTKKRF